MLLLDQRAQLFLLDELKAYQEVGKLKAPQSESLQALNNTKNLYERYFEQALVRPPESPGRADLVILREDIQPLMRA